VSAEDLTLDRFLGGRVIAGQPQSGFRAGHDTVLLAAAVPAESGSVVLELGSGAGIASLCLAARVPGVGIIGIEIDPDLVRLANENATRNAVADRVSFVVGDANASADPRLFFPPPLLSAEARRAKADAGEVFGVAFAKPDGGGPFDHVFFNPPFHPDSSHISLVAARDRATRDSSDSVRTWTGRALSLVREGGTVTAIVRADRVQDILNVAHDYSGIVFPLFPRSGATPKRAIIHIVKRVSLGPQPTIPLPSPLVGEGAHSAAKQRVRGRKGGDTQDSEHFVTATGLVLHESDGRNTEAAEAVLRHGQALF